MADLLKQRGLQINWDQVNDEDFTDRDASILKKMLEGGQYTPEDDPDEIFKELVFGEDGQALNGRDSPEILDTLVKTKKAKPIKWYIIKFDSRFRVYWDLFIILLAVYNCILIPIDVGFGNKFYGKQQRDG